jgi:deazaflavin-dependent oxidoreductase (nitroreductase family)
MSADPDSIGDDLFGLEHVRVYRETGGQVGYDWRGATILLLSTTGRRTGEERTTPLIHRPDGDAWVVVASKGGAPDNPDWYKNLEADPNATIQIKDQLTAVRARTAHEAERERLWQLMTQVWPAYDEYKERTAREIPVVVLEPR